MSLHTVWFIIVATFWCGFFFLEGFDFGVGILHTVVGKTDGERRMVINTIGPFWDGNEVWLIVAGAAIFAAFPQWYATMFSTFYLALLLVLVALIGRGVSFEFRAKRDDPRWRATWTWCLTIGSALIPLLLGLALADLLNGLPINSQHEYTGTFWDLLTPFGLWTGVALLALCVMSGAAFLTLKTTGIVKDRADAVGRRASWVAAALVIGFVVWSTIEISGFLPNPVAIVAGIAALATIWLTHDGRHGWAFAATVVATVSTVATLFINLYPNVMVSSTNPAYNLTVSNASASSYALKVMTVVAVIFVPLVLVYQGWNYWVFRRRLTSPPATTDGAASTDGAAATSGPPPQPAGH